MGRGRYRAEIHSDAADTSRHDNPLPIDVRTETVRASTVLKLKLIAGGGTAIRFRRA
ncbi:glycoside hydrolase family 97 C-terminal domain-containing protein [Streptomyces asiaticus]